MPATFAEGMLERAYRSLDEAASAKMPSAIYVAAYQAAGEATVAIVSARIADGQRQKMKRPNTLWDALGTADPDLADWARYFSSKAHRKHAAELGVPNAVYRDQAEELLRDVHQFLVTAEGIVQQKEAS